jgi:hypothetical protein
MDTGSDLVPKNKKKKNKVVVMCLKILWLLFVQGKSWGMCLEFYTLFRNLHVEFEQFLLMVFGDFVNVQNGDRYRAECRQLSSISSKTF